MEGCFTRPGASHRTESSCPRTGHPFATTGFSKARSAEGTIKDNRTSAYPSQKEATHPRSHLTKDGYQYTSVPPDASIITLTIGQQPTDSYSAESLAISETGYGHTNSPPRG